LKCHSVFFENFNFENFFPQKKAQRTFFVTRRNEQIWEKSEAGANNKYEVSKKKFKKSVYQRRRAEA